LKLPISHQSLSLYALPLLQDGDEEDDGGATSSTDDDQGSVSAALEAFKAAGLGSSPTMLRFYLEQMGKVRPPAAVVICFGVNARWWQFLA
jgi:hypothetical protein